MAHRMCSSSLAKATSGTHLVEHNKADIRQALLRPPDAYRGMQMQLRVLCNAGCARD